MYKIINEILKHENKNDDNTINIVFFENIVNGQ